MATSQTLPISLNLSIFLNGLTSVIVEQRPKEQIISAGWQDEIIDLFSQGQITNGDSIIYNFEQALGAIEQYSKTSSLFTLREPTALTETISIDTYEFTATSFREIIAPQSFVDGSVMSSFLAVLHSRNAKTLHNDLANKMVDMYMGYKPTQATQTIKVTLTDPSTAVDDADFIKIKGANASRIAEALLNAYDNLTIYSNKYTDNNTAYTQTSIDRLVTIVNKGWYNDWQANAFVNAFNSEQLKNNLPTQSTLLPASLHTNANLIATVYDQPKFALVHQYREGSAFRDPSNQYTTYFEHRGIGYGIFKAPACIQLIADFGTTPPPPEE